MSWRLPILLSLLFLPCAVVVPSAVAQAPSSTPAYSRDIKPLLAKYCVSCHGGARPKADFALDIFADEAAALKKRAHWEKVVTQLRTGEMPPPNRPKPTPEEVARINAWVDNEVNKVDCLKRQDPGRVVLRRLNRAEYNNTIHDLIGIQFRPADDFPSDDVGYGFDNIGDVLTLSPLLFEKYLAAAEKIVAEAWKNPELKKRLLPRQPGSQEDRLVVAREVLRPLVLRTYRRPPFPEEVERLVKFVALAQKEGDSFEKGIQLAVQAALVSPHFIFRVERNPKPAPNQKNPWQMVSQYELATRMSYFLWSTMPDEELFRLAAEQKLREPGVLPGQVRRMLKDSKAQALVENFCGQWLQLRLLRTLSPDPKLFPTFAGIRQDMIQETELFFAAVVREDRNVLDFLDAPFTFVNERLAKHYNIPGVVGTEFRKVSLEGLPRRGILTQASVLTVTSNPNRTSPVKRGKWVLENIFNAPPPPPIPDAGELPEDAKAVSSGSLRQRMELHRSKAICASCHARMDPLGFGLENFDAVGGWRTQDGKFAIDASGQLPTGQTFNGPLELVRVLKSKENDFRRCLVEKMLIYALGRGLEYQDKCAIEAVLRSMEKNGNRFSSLMLAIVQSDPFQMRRGKVAQGQ